MIDSRCGLVCSKCDFAKTTGCPGCVNMDKPFWGECSIKKCCEDKKLENCGMCNDFPCKILNDFAYDTEHGTGDGERINQCKRWCGK